MTWSADSLAVHIESALRNHEQSGSPLDLVESLEAWFGVEHKDFWLTALNVAPSAHHQDLRDRATRCSDWTSDDWLVHYRGEWVSIEDRGLLGHTGVLELLSIAAERSELVDEVRWYFFDRLKAAYDRDPDDWRTLLGVVHEGIRVLGELDWRSAPIPVSAICPNFPFDGIESESDVASALVLRGDVKTGMRIWGALSSTSDAEVAAAALHALVPYAKSHLERDWD